MTNLEKLTNVFVETFSIDASKTAGLQYQGIEAWDSVGHMSLVAAIEDAFDIMMEMDDIIDFLEHQAKKTGINIISPKKSGPKVSVSVSASHKMKVHHDNKDSFFNRVFCSGLFSSLYILPDGKVTICEQLYWNKDFIIGDVTKNSIQEIWDSDKAKSLYYIKQEDIPSDSLCHSCEDFEKCRRPRQVCYREIIKKYGTEKWYYPDVKCPYVYR